MQTLAEIGTLSMINIDGKRQLRVLKAGSGSPLILLHTIRTQLDYFEAVIPALAKHHTVYALDLPGHGHSSIHTEDQYDEPYMRSAVLAFIQQLELTDIILVGESIGGVLALTVAASLPAHVSQVIASNTYDYDKRYADGVRRGNWFANIVLANYAIPMHGAIFAALENWLFLGIVMKGGLHKKRWMPKRLLSAINRAGYRKGFRYVERNVFKHWASWGQAKSLYADVKAPVKLIYSEHDWSTIAERESTAKALGNISITTISDAGHFGFVDNPDALIEAILA